MGKGSSLPTRTQMARTRLDSEIMRCDNSVWLVEW
jgi:hypothetical protein